ncbi:ornithine decarboxylase (plasmid) [Rhizobium ruizarguesonis]|uniref:Ornithine decarboxylase n=1 Tax=Rhizobium leguminosarum TaxID=384 RepID=A0A7M3DJ83_RHILE|nr:MULTISPECIES: aminotransferase class I/II-fold pyridoxal phosphate-dependent enzyme [Rhizobium]TAU13349.1 ornithine decarboxylase [Rhizobium leguminosarum]TAU15570.1 ornithine decarboxylase [Rhizobium ruizarguesonis]TAU59160.1 ornithine decarboxylase [Rhizobium ruizarguesonis]TAV03374.1 ornithine decarboxylase [Rhizobium ruizarguesonis]TAV22543.1 ornithine decarboxylase [Rhizobium ruizarguesonis]
MAADTPETSLNNCLSISDLRSDNWKSLEDNLGWLSTISADHADFITTSQQVTRVIEILSPIEAYQAYPGARAFAKLGGMIQRQEMVRAHLLARGFRKKIASLAHRQRYSEVLFVGKMSSSEQKALRRSLKRKTGIGDFAFDAVFVQTFEDALNALRVNLILQAVVIHDGFAFRSQDCHLDTLHSVLDELEVLFEATSESERGPLLGREIAKLRPEVDLYLVADSNVEDIAARMGETFERVFYREADCDELYPSIMRDVARRYDADWFNGVKGHAKRPISNFHALTASRGKSIMNSNWIRDRAQFYGPTLFQAETSATSGGLDSLLEPRGPLKIAQEKAARAFGAKRTFFCTNGTSGANNIVVQALVRRGDVVIVDRNSHTSVHRGLMRAGARVDYLDAYPLNDYSIYGAVPLEELKRKLLDHKHAGTLDRVCLLILTNSTFDGIVCDPKRVMKECLAIAPHLAFLWDEAWFTFAYFNPTYRQRTAMGAAAELEAMFQDPDYAASYKAFNVEFGAEAWADDERILNTPLLADPSKARVRVYATQSTHKGLMALRQGSMIHIRDQDFNEKAFGDAYKTHTTTSPNYQILATLDLARAQVELEGYKCVRHQLERATTLRQQVSRDPLLSKYFRVLGVGDLVPSEYRESNAESYFDEKSGWINFEKSWLTDEFVLDPTHITLEISATGLSGDTLKKHLDKCDIQINKTTRNTILPIITIGTTRSDVAIFIQVLRKIALDCEERARNFSKIERSIHDDKVRSLALQQPLPRFSSFHQVFRPNMETGDGDMGLANDLAMEDDNCEYLQPADVERAISGGRVVVSASLVLPYPPGSPILSPGQVIDIPSLKYLRALDVREIHGFDQERGLRVFREETLSKLSSARKSTPDHGGES